MKRSICMLVAALYLAGCTTLSTVPHSRGATPEQICEKDECVRTVEIESVDRKSVV